MDNSAQLSRTPSPQPITNLQIETSQQTHLLSLSNTINNNSTQNVSKFLIASTASSKPIIFDVESKGQSTESYFFDFKTHFYSLLIFQTLKIQLNFVTRLDLNFRPLPPTQIVSSRD